MLRPAHCRGPSAPASRPSIRRRLKRCITASGSARRGRRESAYPDEHPVLPPHLLDPPSIVPIDVGRQLFVDDFLIEETSLLRTWHRPDYHPANPILRPQTEWELRDDVSDRTGQPRNPSAMVFSDGVFFDPKDRLFKMWAYGRLRRLHVPGRVA